MRMRIRSNALSLRECMQLVPLHTGEWAWFSHQPPQQHLNGKPCIAHSATKRVTLLESVGTSHLNTVPSPRHRDIPSLTVPKKARRNRPRGNPPHKGKVTLPRRTRRRKGKTKEMTRASWCSPPPKCPQLTLLLTMDCRPKRPSTKRCKESM